MPPGERHRQSSGRHSVKVSPRVRGEFASSFSCFSHSLSGILSDTVASPPARCAIRRTIPFAQPALQKVAKMRMVFDQTVDQIVTFLQWNQLK